MFRVVLQEKAIAIENDIRGLLRNFGLKVGAAGVIKFEERVRELVEGMPDLAEIMTSLLDARQKLREQVRKLHRKLLSIVREDKVCRRLMTVPGIGPVVSLAFTAAIDDPARFKSSKAVGLALGLTPVLNQRERAGAPLINCFAGTPHARTLNARTGEYPSFASRRIDVPRGTRDEVSSRRALVPVAARDQNAHQIGPPHLPDPIMGEPKSRSRREERIRE